MTQEGCRTGGVVTGDICSVMADVFSLSEELTFIILKDDKFHCKDFFHFETLFV